ncbi:uncharacterized protein [Montipora capricornis]|uniref:uncharacterized protein n=1 Tax=Montipora capricornis TaxID=246305 RepID=UPI0035F1F3C2
MKQAATEERKRDVTIVTALAIWPKSAQVRKEKWKNYSVIAVGGGGTKSLCVPPPGPGLSRRQPNNKKSKMIPEREKMSFISIISNILLLLLIDINGLILC